MCMGLNNPATQLVFSLMTGVLDFKTLFQLLLGYIKTIYINNCIDFMFSKQFNIVVLQLFPKQLRSMWLVNIRITRCYFGIC